MITSPPFLPTRTVAQPATTLHPGIHFEICFDEANLERLLGRRPDSFDYERPPIPTQDGRANVVFGDMYIYLPAWTPFSVERPKEAFRPGAEPGSTIGAAQ